MPLHHAGSSAASKPGIATRHAPRAEQALAMEKSHVLKQSRQKSAMRLLLAKSKSTAVHYTEEHGSYDFACVVVAKPNDDAATDGKPTLLGMSFQLQVLGIVSRFLKAGLECSLVTASMLTHRDKIVVLVRAPEPLVKAEWILLQRKRWVKSGAGGVRAETDEATGKTSLRGTSEMTHADRIQLIGNVIARPVADEGVGMPNTDVPELLHAAEPYVLSVFPLKDELWCRAFVQNWTKPLDEAQMRKDLKKHGVANAGHAEHEAAMKHFREDKIEQDKQASAILHSQIDGDRQSSQASVWESIRGAFRDGLINRWDVLAKHNDFFIQELRVHYGEKAALYFAFTDLYTVALIPLAATGVLLYLLNIFLSFHIYLLALSVFGFLTSWVWAPFLVILWQRRSYSLMLGWGLADTAESDHVNPFYKIGHVVGKGRKLLSSMVLFMLNITFAFTMLVLTFGFVLWYIKIKNLPVCQQCCFEQHEQKTHIEWSTVKDVNVTIPGRRDEPEVRDMRLDAIFSWDDGEVARNMTTMEGSSKKCSQYSTTTSSPASQVLYKTLISGGTKKLTNTELNTTSCERLHSGAVKCQLLSCTWVRNCVQWGQVLYDDGWVTDMGVLDRTAYVVIEMIILVVMLDVGLVVIGETFAKWIISMQNIELEDDYVHALNSKAYGLLWLSFFAWFLVLPLIFIPYGAEMAQLSKVVFNGFFVFKWNMELVQVDSLFIVPLVLSQIVTLLAETFMAHLMARSMEKAEKKMREHFLASQKIEKERETKRRGSHAGRRQQAKHDKKVAKADRKARRGSVENVLFDAADAGGTAVNIVGKLGIGGVKKVGGIADKGLENVFEGLGIVSMEPDALDGMSTQQLSDWIGDELNDKGDSLTEGQRPLGPLPVINTWFDAERDASDQIVAEGNLPVMALESDYADMCIQFSYITMFTICWPFCPLLGLVNNYFEIRSDAWRCLVASRRPIPRRPSPKSGAIGAWKSILQMEVMVAILISSLLFTQSTGQLEAWIEVFSVPSEGTALSVAPPLGDQTFLDGMNNGSASCMTVNTENALFHTKESVDAHNDRFDELLTKYMGPNPHCYGGLGKVGLGWRFVISMVCEHFGLFCCIVIFKSFRRHERIDDLTRTELREQERELMATTIFGPEEKRQLSIEAKNAATEAAYQLRRENVMRARKKLQATKSLFAWRHIPKIAIESVEETTGTPTSVPSPYKKLLYHKDDASGKALVRVASEDAAAKLEAQTQNQRKHISGDGLLLFSAALAAFEKREWDEALRLLERTIAVISAKLAESVFDLDAKQLEMLREAVSYRLALTLYQDSLLMLGDLYHESASELLDEDAEPDVSKTATQRMDELIAVQKQHDSIRSVPKAEDLNVDPAKLLRLAETLVYLATVFIRPKHRVRFVRHAIKVNLLLRNYGLAARYLTILLKFAKGERAKEKLRAELRRCERGRFTNAGVPMSAWSDDQTIWACGICRGADVDVVSGRCESESCGAHNRFCAVGRVPLSVSSTLWCPLCYSVFERTFERPEHQQNAPCSICNTGLLMEPGAQFYMNEEQQAELAASAAAAAMGGSVVDVGGAAKVIVERL